MRTLVIDTATQALSVALFDADDCIAHSHELVGRGHAERLLPAIAALPDGGRADRIVADIGPGSFTGVRIGVAAARALGLAWGVPVTGYGAPALITAAARIEHGNDMPIAVAITGGHGELFWQIFDPVNLQPVKDIVSIPINLLAGQTDISVIYGTGAEALIAARGSGRAVTLYPDSRNFALMSPESHQAAPRPVYGRGADAMTMADRAAKIAGA